MINVYAFLHLYTTIIDSETIDFLPGRTNTAVFSNHYPTPNQYLKCKVLDAINKLRIEIEK
jgi:hypothetical protein